MSDYTDALANRLPPIEPETWSPFDEALLLQTLTEQQPEVYAPAVRPPTPTPVLQQLAPIAPAERPYDPWPTRLGFGSVFVLSSGTAVYIACVGLHEAGGALPWLAGSLAALAALVGLLKLNSGGSVKISNFHQGDNSVFQAGQQR